MVLRFFDEGIDEKLRCAFHGRVGFGEEGFVARVIVVIPEMEGEPGAAGGPHAGADAIDGSGGAPEVGVVMHDPAAGVVHFLRGARAGVGEVHDHGDEGVDCFGEVGGLGGPVVHFGVDVDGVFGAPGRVHRLVPEALEVGGLAAGAGTGDEEVAAELEVEGG